MDMHATSVLHFATNLMKSLLGHRICGACSNSMWWTITKFKMPVLTCGHLFGTSDLGRSTCRHSSYVNHLVDNLQP